MRYPPRLAHLATTQIVAQKLVPAYAAAHHVDDEEARIRLHAALRGTLLERLLEATWGALEAKARRFQPDKVLERIFETLKERPFRPGRKLTPTPELAAFWLLVDLEVGTAGDSARRVMESEAGREKASQGLEEAGRYLAAELTRGP